MLVAPGAIETIVAHARRESPHECCGFLVGTADRLEESVAMTNVLASPSRFAVDPGEHIALNRRLRGSGREVIGVYHSHPRSPAVPSATDIANAHYPEFLHVIVSLAAEEPEIAAFRIRDGIVSAVDLLRSFPVA
jgi:[CysO sulfur-carrier protein]-S-L-cysteine hydrolase